MTQDGTRGGGFGRGLATGLVLAALILAILAVAFPPVRYDPPDLGSLTQEAPPAPEMPNTAGISRSPGEVEVTPLRSSDRSVLDLPEADAADPVASTLTDPGSAPEVFDATTGSPSLVQPQAD